MEQWQQRVAKTIAVLTVLAFVTSVAYHSLMVTVEGSAAGYFHSTQVVIETFTGTGYGSDAPWESPVANLFVIGVDLSTFLILFIVLPYVFQPILEDRLSPTAPRSTALTDHVVVACELTARVERLMDEFEARGVEYVVVAADEETVIDLESAGRSAIRGDPTAAAALGRANVGDAAAVLVDVAGTDAPSAVLSVREHDDDVLVVAQCESPSLRTSLEYAGADTVVMPRQLVGRRIADRLLSEFDLRFSDIVSLGDEFAMVEVTIDESSPIHGTTLGESGLSASDDVTVAGLWYDGEYRPDPSPETVLDRTATVILTGSEAELRAIEIRSRPDTEAATEVVIAGAGEVGSTARDRLSEAGVTCTVIDLREEVADVTGDATDEAVLREAGVEDADAFVAALADDNDAILSVLHARTIAGEIDIAARMNGIDTESKARRAGATYVLSVPDISGRLVALNVLREAVLSYDRQVEVVGVEADDLPGSTLSDPAVRESDCFPVAIERNGQFRTDISPETTLESGDRVVVAGDDDGIDELRSRIG